MTEGTLVWFELCRGEWHPGIVLRYRPNVLGGSSSQSYRVGNQIVNEFITDPVRGECLIRLFDGEGVSWVDEKKLRTPEEHEMASAQGAS